MKKQERIAQYNEQTGYNITNTKKMTREQLQYQKINSYKSLQELYKNPSDYKITSYRDILQKYQPIEIIGVQGSHFNYSVLLQADNGDYLHITKSNNYLINVKE